MDTTNPTANFQPQIVQYTPIERSIENSVLALVSPSSSNLAFVRTKTRANLSFDKSTPIAPSPAAPLPQREPVLAGVGWLSSARLNAATRADTVRCWVVSGGRRSSALRQAPSSALESPARVARSASAARRFSCSAA